MSISANGEEVGGWSEDGNYLNPNIILPRATVNHRGKSYLETQHTELMAGQLGKEFTTIPPLEWKNIAVGLS